MTKLNHKLAKLVVGAAIRVVTLALFLAVFGASAALAQTIAYVANGGDNTVSIIDTATNTVTAAVPVGGFPTAIAVTPNGAFAYVANSGSNTVSVINMATNTVTAPDDQVPFTATGTAVLTGVTKLPGGLTQLDFTLSGTATHLGNTSGPGTRIQNNQGNFTSSGVLIGANEEDSVFLTISGQSETSKDKCVITSTGTYTVTGGTGAFANATGSGTIVTQIDLCAGAALGTYTGTISRPHSNYEELA